MALEGPLGLAAGGVALAMDLNLIPGKALKDEFVSEIHNGLNSATDTVMSGFAAAIDYLHVMAEPNNLAPYQNHQ
jgi:hypothetical protein